MRRDLFDAEDGGYAQDAAFLDRLVTERLSALADTVRAEGWSWVEAHADFGYDARGQYRRISPEHAPLPEAEAAELETLEAEHEELQDVQYGEDGEEEATIIDRLDEIGERIGELARQAAVWTPEQMATAGAVVHLSCDGEAEVERGLIRREIEPESTHDDEPETMPPPLPRR